MVVKERGVYSVFASALEKMYPVMAVWANL